MRELIAQLVAKTAILNVAEAVNMGREDGFNDIINEIKAFQYSAILDEATCPECEELDGQYFEPGDPGLEAINPPLHINCRCMLVAVLKEEQTPFKIEFSYLSGAEIDRLTARKFW